MEEYWGIIIFLNIVWVVIATVIGSKKGKTGAGFALGLFLGLIGIAIIASMQPNNAVLVQNQLQSGEFKKCSHCAELIKAEATICRFCGNNI